MNFHKHIPNNQKTEASIIGLKEFPKAILQPLRPIDGLLPERLKLLKQKTEQCTPEALTITSMLAETDKCTHEAAVSE